MRSASRHVDGGAFSTSVDDKSDDGLYLAACELAKMVNIDLRDG